MTRSVVSTVDRSKQHLQSTGAVWELCDNTANLPKGLFLKFVLLSLSFTIFH